MLYGCMLPNLCEGELKCNTNLFPALLHHSSLCNLFPTKTHQQYKSWANQAFLCRLFIVCHDWPCKRLMHRARIYSLLCVDSLPFQYKPPSEQGASRRNMLWRENKCKSVVKISIIASRGQRNWTNKIEVKVAFSWLSVRNENLRPLLNRNILYM